MQSLETGGLQYCRAAGPHCGQQPDLLLTEPASHLPLSLNINQNEKFCVEVVCCSSQLALLAKFDWVHSPQCKCTCVRAEGSLIALFSALYFEKDTRRTREYWRDSSSTGFAGRVSAVFCQIYFLKDFNVKGRTSQLWSAVGQLGCTSCEMCARAAVAAVAAHQAAPKLSFSPLLDLAQLQPWPLQPSPVM